MKKNIFLFFIFFIAILVVVFLRKNENFEGYLPFLFAGFVFIFLIEKALLGNSLKFTLITLPSFFLLSYIILMSLPSIFWFFKMDTHIKYTYFLAIQSVLITFPIGVGLASRFFQYRSRIITNFLSSGLAKTRSDQQMFPFFVLMFIFSILTIIIYICSADYVPLFGSITRYGELDALTVRYSIYRVPDIIRYSLALTLRMFLPFCLLYSYFMNYVYKGKWKYVFWIMLFLMLCASLLTFERVYSFSLFIFLILAAYFKNYQSISKINIRLIVFVFTILILAIFIGGIVSIMQYNIKFINFEKTIDVAKSFLFNRVLGASSYMAYISFEEFSDPTLFLYGKSFRLLSLFGTEFRSITPPSFIAELWLNFGWGGIIIGTIMIGFILEFLQLVFFRKKSIPFLSFYILLLLNGGWLIYGHVLGTMTVSVFLITISFLFLLLALKKPKVLNSALHLNKEVSVNH